ncbi:unnamed protein product [Mytilus coruscus]|uniref:Core-binding (CB) domain-containing protein n=1 Tax=Mytilus coruscus TaxID=42192 RepID=A0A6J8AQS5_MYTCO|nr:unnamed protein product [Mytilus coruscus]
MASCIELIPNARLYMRPIQLHLLSFWRPACHPVTQHLKSHLIWWLNSANTLKGRSLQPQQTCITITTDASKTGYGGVMDKKIFQGEWSVLESKKHINYLELEAVVLTIKHFLNYLIGKSVLIRSDNITVVQYINKQGGTKSPQSCYKTWELWTLAIQSNITLKAAHIMGKKNIIADYLSRKKILHTEWSLNTQIVQKLFLLWDQPLMDLFASAENRQTKVFCSWIPHPQAFALDALTISWEKILPSQSPIQSDLLSVNRGPKSFIGPRGIQSDCLASINRSFQAEGFSKEARNLLSASWRKGTQKDYSAKFKKYCSWCSTREINLHNATLNQVADFLAYLFESGLQYRTIAGYRSMLSKVLPQVDNTAVGQHPYITRLIKGVFNSRPPTTKLLPEWDLQLVLTLLQKEPFEPIENIDLKHLTFKTVFLVSITTFRRWRFAVSQSEPFLYEDTTKRHYIY